MAERIDAPGPVRPGEELAADRLTAFLRAELGLAVATLEVRQFRGGFSNLTYLLAVDGRELVLRRPPFGSQVRSAHDVLREHRILSRLAGRLPVAQPLAACADPSVLGAPFYLVERVPGMILRGGSAAAPDGLDPATRRQVDEAVVDQMVALHRLVPAALGLGDLGRPEGYVERQVRGWSERYRAARIDDVPDLEALMAWLAAHQLSAQPARAALVHNDFKHDNLVLDPDQPSRVVAILDWEMATAGDPYLDLATTLGYWVEAGDPPGLRRLGLSPTDRPGSLERRAVVERYATQSGADVPAPDFLRAFGLFKVAVIAQQIYVRYRRGLTRDERFAALGSAVTLLAGQAEAVAGGGPL